MIKKNSEHIARARIVQARRDNQDIIDLSHLGLSKLWNGLWELQNLTKLDLSGNELTTLPAEIGQLGKLVTLDLSNNELTVLPAEIGLLVNLTKLELRSNSLISLPVEIGQLVNLKSLDLTYNALISFPPEFGRLPNLQELIITNNHFQTLPPEIFNLKNMMVLEATDLELATLPAEVKHLENLQSLIIHNNLLSTLPPEIGQLQNLVQLSIGDNQLKEFPKEIIQLKNLDWLSIGDQSGILPKLNIIRTGGPVHGTNHISTLPSEISCLTELIFFEASGIGITDLPKEIKSLNNLNRLVIANNQLSTLPDEINQLTKLEWLCLQGNPLLIPPEILKKTQEPQAILNYYFSRQKKPLNETKLIVIGQGSVGKTSLIDRIRCDTFDPEQNKTEGISISQWRVADQQATVVESASIKLNLWDFGGQEIMHATHQFFLTKRSLYLMVLDARLTQEENRVEYWLKIIQSFGGGSPVLIVGNKTDQHPLDIDRTGLQKKYPNLVGILETSAATGAGVETLKTEIANQVNALPHVRDLLPETWFTVKTKLEKLGQETNFISHDDYDKLCDMNDVRDETSQHTLIGFLHDLGVVLYFQDDPRLESLGILNPQWVTNGVYRILNSHELFQSQGVLTLAMLDEILNVPEYPRGKRLYIVDMMKKFELCYDIELDKTFLVPDLLPKDQPELNFNGTPAFEYQYPVLPSSVMTRFIVRMNRHIQSDLVWRSGVVLKIGENLALVKADVEDKTISISIDGLEHTRRDALSAIRYQLDEIHDSLKGLNPQKRVPIPNAPNAEPLDYDYLLQLERDNELEVLPVKDGSRLVKVNIRQLLSGIESESKRKETVGNVTNIYVGGDVGGSLVAGDQNDISQ